MLLGVLQCLRAEGSRLRAFVAPGGWPPGSANPYKETFSWLRSGRQDWRSRPGPSPRALLVELEHGHEGLLGHIHLAHGLHAFFALGLFLQ